MLNLNVFKIFYVIQNAWWNPLGILYICLDICTAYVDNKHSWNFKQNKWNCRRTNPLFFIRTCEKVPGPCMVVDLVIPALPQDSCSQLQPAKYVPNIRLNCWPKCSNRWACTQTLTKNYSSLPCTDLSWLYSVHIFNQSSSSFTSTEIPVYFPCQFQIVYLQVPLYCTV